MTNIVLENYFQNFKKEKTSRAFNKKKNHGFLSNGSKSWTLKRVKLNNDFQCQTWKDKEIYLIQNVKKEKEENGKKRKWDFKKKIREITGTFTAKGRLLHMDNHGRDLTEGN